MIRPSRQLDKLKSAEEFAEDRGLSENEKRFAYEYIKDRSTSKAAERARVSTRTGQRALNKSRVKDFIEHLESRRYMAGMASEPEQLKGQMQIWANSNMQDYSRIKNMEDIENLTRAEASCIKKIKCKTKYNEKGELEEQEVTLELYDAVKANETLGKPHGIYEQIKIDLSLLDFVSPEDLEMLRKKYGLDGNDNS